ncbi:MAG: winged helix-turn-helix transcriptional regulator [Candidatus Hodarchaeales archaeon]|jgi:DNA-binding HxlR family transcriptional regulator
MESENIPENEDKLEWHCANNHMNDTCSTECLLRSVFDLFGKKFTLLIVRLLLVNKKMRFNELEKEIGGSPKTITQRLRDLEGKGLVSRKVYNEIPVRVEYSLTEAGIALDSVFSTISKWVKLWITK